LQKAGVLLVEIFGRSTVACTVNLSLQWQL